jgi:hypothetical protein
MNKQLTNDQKKIDLVARLVKDGAIDFKEAIELMEERVVVEKEYVYLPYVNHEWVNPLAPYVPYQPFPDQLFQVTCNTVTRHS